MTRGLLPLVLALAACAHGHADRGAPPAQAQRGPHLLYLRPTYGQQPQLPREVRVHHQGQTVVAVYIVAVDVDGNVREVESKTKVEDVDAAVIPVLMTWQFNRQEIPIRTPLRFEFVIPR